MPIALFAGAKRPLFPKSGHILLQVEMAVVSGKPRLTEMTLKDVDWFVDFINEKREELGLA